ncbi:MAG: enoyl-CoA hydratase/isomerase family protein [Lysobacterales bacterium]
MTDTLETISLERTDGLAIVHLNQPERLNALNEQMRQEIMSTVDVLATEDSVRALIITGNSDKAFVAGADISEFAGRSLEEQTEVYQRRRVYEALAAFPKPAIAAIHGYCYGGGCELALACDMRIADSTASFGQLEVRLGLVPGAGGTQRLARLVGYGQAFKMAATGDTIDAPEALRIGLIEEMVEPGKHLERARELAGRMTRWSPVAVSLIKELVSQSSEVPVSKGIALEKAAFLKAFASEDGQEGVTAFTEKRRAKFTGR